ncbi:MAG TPA: hypothetical protein VM536_03740 [Chloroflexia bacterium]|nr:hypothetical protein [Chloroflexia bacterium]
MTLILPLLFSFLLAGQVVRKWNAPVILVMIGWIVLVIGVNVFLLR